MNDTIPDYNLFRFGVGIGLLICLPYLIKLKSYGDWQKNMEEMLQAFYADKYINQSKGE